MKKITKIAVFTLIFCTISLFGCGKTELLSATITRDSEMIGGSLSFVYNSDSRKIYVGGDGEVVQFSSEDETRELSAGNRIGLKITAPIAVEKLDEAVLEINDVRYSGGSFLETINGQTQRFFNIYPIVSSDNMSVEFSITWGQNSKKQIYVLEVVSGTKFQNADGEIV